MNASKLLIHGGRIFTADPDRPWAEALLIDGDKIVLEMDHPLGPCLVRDPDEPMSFFVVMPMRLD